mgnify:CR=1 FL=1|tara:strand:- start:34 stop:663 length:630 start_codon:yes stop_codon:yes gene_type:complete
MLRKIKLYGELADCIGFKTLEAEVNNIAQTISFLIHNFPQAESHIAANEYTVFIDDWNVDEKELTHPAGQGTVKIIPVIAGAGGDNATRIILGVALIGVAIVAPAAGFGLGTAGGGLQFGTSTLTGISMGGLAAFAGNIGLALTLYGISGLLSPEESIEESEQDPRRSFSFSGIQNTSRAGVAVPVIYGEVLTGSVVISAGIDTVQVEA